MSENALAIVVGITFGALLSLLMGIAIYTELQDNNQPAPTPKETTTHGETHQ